MSDTQIILKKAKEAAKQYLYSYAVWCQSDCSDSYNSMGMWKHSYDFLMDFNVHIEDFIVDQIHEEIENAKLFATLITGEPWNDKPTVAPFPF